MIKKICEKITRVNVFFAENIVAWLIIPLMAIMVLEVISRYFLKSPTLFAFDLTWMLYGTLTFLAGGYVLSYDGHVRADVFYNKFPQKIKRLISVLCYGCLFFPWMYGLVTSSWNSLIKAIESSEVSGQTIWAPTVIPMRVILFISVVILLLQGIVMFISYFTDWKVKEDKQC